MDDTVKFTKTDELILASCKATLIGLSAYLGTGYEIVLHRLDHLDHSAMLVLNGYHSGRKNGAPITSLALEMLDKIQKGENPAEAHIYGNTSSSGEQIHACTIPVLGEKQRIIGLICMNFYMNTPVYDIISNLFNQSQAKESLQETFSADSDHLISYAIVKAKARAMKDPSISTSNKNKKIIEYLIDANIFRLKNAVEKVAGQLGISKNTVYLHLRNIKKNKSEGQ